MIKVAIIIPTMNRPDFMLRQFEFYEYMNSPHPIYVLDSSNPENAKKLTDGISRLKGLSITYKWGPPGTDYVYTLMPLVKEKYCIQSCDDDLVIPDTISECAEFLENNPDYGTCAGKQINIRLLKEDYNKPYGVIERQTRPLGRSIEDENMLKRVKDFWSSQYFICFAVTRTDTQRLIRNITKHFGMASDMFEFILFNILLTSGKAKVIDRLGYIMQRSDLPFFDHSLTEQFLSYPAIQEEWKVCEDEFSEILRKKGLSEKDSRWAVKWLFVVYLAQQYDIENRWLAIDQKGSGSTHKNSIQPQNIRSTKKIIKQAKYVFSAIPFLKNIYYRFNPPDYVDRKESSYYKDFKKVKDFLENKSS